MTFTHNHKDDTVLERDGNEIVFIFTNDPFTCDSDTFRFRFTQKELLNKIGDYFDCGMNADLFDDLTLPQQDALWNALVFMEKNNIDL